MTFFSNIEHRFLPIPDDKRILTEPFLQACREAILPFLDKFGTALIPVKKDVGGNVSKLEKKFNMDKEKFATINSMLEEELETNSSDLARVGTLWLARGLNFICAIMKVLSDNYKSGVIEDNLGVVTRAAYEKTLKQYHGWVTQKMIAGVTRALPSRQTLFKSLADESAPESQIMTDMSDFVEGLAKNYEVLAEVLKKSGIDDQTKVE